MLHREYDDQKTPLVSVVIPIYNVEEYLTDCVNSVINQTYTNIEIILVDDGSNDSSSQLCDEFEKNDNRIKVIHKANGGLSDARNTGMEYSAGDFICFIDSDDYIDVDYIAELLGLLLENNCDVAICSFKKVKRAEEYIKNCNNCVELYTGKDIIDHIYGEDYIKTIVAWNKLYRKSLFDNIRYPVGLIHEDEATTCTILYCAEKVVVTDSVLYFYRIRDNSITTSEVSIDKLQAKLDSLKIRRNFFRDNKLEMYYSKDYLVYLKQVSINCYLSRNINNEYMKKMKLEFHLVYKESDKKEWNLKNRMLMLLSYINPGLYGFLKLKYHC